MRVSVSLLGAVALALLPGCGSSSGDPDGPGTPGPPVPLKQAVLNDIHGLSGGDGVWVSEKRVAFVQVVDAHKKEKRYRLTITDDQWALIEYLVGKYDFLHLTADVQRHGKPDKPGHSIRLVTKAGEKVKAFKWERDKRPRFDPLSTHLFSIIRQTEGRELIYEGDYDRDWIPDGFSNPW